MLLLQVVNYFSVDFGIYLGSLPYRKAGMQVSSIFHVRGGMWSIRLGICAWKVLDLNSEAGKGSVKLAPCAGPFTPATLSFLIYILLCTKKSVTRTFIVT